jgi:magnesium-transporting ATPase (P-type)
LVPKYSYLKLRFSPSGNTGSISLHQFNKRVVLLACAQNSWDRTVFVQALSDFYLVGLVKNNTLKHQWLTSHCWLSCVFLNLALSFLVAVAGTSISKASVCCTNQANQIATKALSGCPFFLTLIPSIIIIMQLLNMAKCCKKYSANASDFNIFLAVFVLDVIFHF